MIHIGEVTENVNKVIKSLIKGVRPNALTEQVFYNIVCK